MIADLAHAADSLTLARLGFALLLVGAVATDRLALAAWLRAAGTLAGRTVNAALAGHFR